MDNTINLPGYNSEIDYGSNHGHDIIIQYTYHFSWGAEIAFYNHRKDEINEKHNSLIAVWHIKERKQLA